MRTIQQIENLNLETLDRKTVVEIKDDLLQSLYHTTLKETTSDGRVLKNVIADQLDRFRTYLMNTRS
jgi:hypothetical protein